MKTTDGRFAGLVLAWAIMACFAASHAGDLITDNLTVYRKLAMPSADGVTAPTNGLVLHFRFATNTVPVADESGYGNTGTVYGATWITNGVRDGAYSFDGSDDNIRVPDSASINPTAAITINAWVKLNVQSANRFIVSKYWDGATRDYEIHIDNDNSFYFQIAIGNVHRGLDSNYVIPTGSWYMVTATYDGSAMKTYVNGTLCSSVAMSGTMNNSNERLAVGALAYAGSLMYFLNGSIDGVRIYSRALSAQEVGDLFVADGATFIPEVTFAKGVRYTAPLGDISMGSFTNAP